jgi:hypothetical protein
LPSIPLLQSYRRIGAFHSAHRDNLIRLANDADLCEVTAIEVPTVFKDFDDFWRPFTLSAGPAPGYCMALAPLARERLKEALRESLAPNADSQSHWALARGHSRPLHLEEDVRRQLACVAFGVHARVPISCSRLTTQG